MRTKDGAVLTPEAEAALVTAAQAGYDPEKLVPRKAVGTTLAVRRRRK